MPFTGERREFSVEAATLRQSLNTAKDRFPLLRVHLEDETGIQRPHVSIFYNDTELRQLGSLDQPVREGDEITILQAISGG